MAIFDPTNTFSSKESSNNNLESDVLLLKIIKPVYCFSLSKIHFYGSFSSLAESSSWCTLFLVSVDLKNLG